MMTADPTAKPRKVRTDYSKRHYESTGEINPAAVYSASDACSRLCWGGWAFRKARRKGLRVIRDGCRVYMRGSDIVAYFNRLAAEQAGD